MTYKAWYFQLGMHFPDFTSIFQEVKSVPGIMFVQRYFGRWIVGCVAVSFVGLLMLLTPPSILVSLRLFLI